MRIPTTIAAGLTLALSLSAPAAPTAWAADMESHAHMGHVMTGWNDTPDGMGLLPIAKAEAEIAAAHAGYAASDLSDLDSMKLHIEHVLSAVDPSTGAAGPGMGYGVLKAAQGVAAHIGFAADAGDASGNVKTHAEHVASAAQNTVARAEEIVLLGKQVLDAERAEAAAPMVEKIAVLSDALIGGIDADGDGTIGWQAGEGGLAVAETHMGFMMSGEGM